MNCNCYDTKEFIAERKCPDCGFSHMFIFDDGSFRCGKCLSSGLICCESHRYLLKEKGVRDKVKNDYVLNAFICKNCGCLTTEKLCRYCLKLN